MNVVKPLSLWVGIVLTSGVMAAPVPPITGSSLIEMPQTLTTSEQAGLDIAKRWINGTDKPFARPTVQSLTFLANRCQAWCARRSKPVTFS
uniref:Conjugative transfer protein TrbG n=1 Tax=Vibrio parahaemolyticus TaxID=670 RepID=A0A1Y1B9X1_VIBPH|nr:hypothetical protein [Vibrio parahaemolyticus]BAX56934.1 conjugative transfer protein TrbG [Vibrio parahaemolyticus]